MTTVVHKVVPTNPMDSSRNSGTSVIRSDVPPGPASHPSGISPGGVGVQVEHGLAPAVNRQRDTEDPNNVHHDSSPGLRGRKRRSML